MESVAPAIVPLSANCRARNLPKRELLSLRTVRAQPKASVSGDDAWMRASRPPSERETMRRYCRMYLALSVFPAPLSPVMSMAWLRPVSARARNICSASVNTCGSAWSGARAPCVSATLASEYSPSMARYGLSATITRPARA